MKRDDRFKPNYIINYVKCKCTKSSKWKAEVFKIKKQDTTICCL